MLLSILPQFLKQLFQIFFTCFVVFEASADQRKGRAGRTQAGKCYRLYSEQTFSQKFTPSTPEDMIREDVSSVVLHL